MTVNFDPRAMEAKRQRAAELERQVQMRVRRGLHPTDFAVIVAAVSIIAACVAAFMGA